LLRLRVLILTVHILFAATTVFLLKAVTLQADGGDSYTELQNVDNCVSRRLPLDTV
jgi:hypothetical protein